MLLSFLSFNAKAQFTGAALANKHFPKPVDTEPVPTSTVSGGFWPTFYNQRNNGSCYNVTADFDGFTTPGDENIYVWAINFGDVKGYDNAVAYEITDPSGTILYRGTQYIGADLANLQVGVYREFGTANYNLVVAYWSAGGSGTGEIRLGTYRMTTTGTFLLSDVLLFTCSLPDAQHINMDCHDLNSFVVVWEDQSYSCYIYAGF